MKKIITLIFCIGQMFFGIAQSCSPLDSSFGTNGSAVGLTTSNNGINTSNIIVQPDNKIVQVGGMSGNGFTVIRYNSNGTIDNNFGQNGKAIASVGVFVNSQYGALQNDGKIVVAGVACHVRIGGATREAHARLPHHRMCFPFRCAGVADASRHQR